MLPLPRPRAIRANRYFGDLGRKIGRAARVEPELDRARDLVDVLPARPRSAHEIFDELAFVDEEGAGFHGRRLPGFAVLRRFVQFRAGCNRLSIAGPGTLFSSLAAERRKPGAAASRRRTPPALPSGASFIEAGSARGRRRTREPSKTRAGTSLGRFAAPGLGAAHRWRGRRRPFARRSARRA